VLKVTTEKSLSNIGGGRMNGWENKLGAKKKTQEIVGRGGEIGMSLGGVDAEGNHTHLRITKFFIKNILQLTEKFYQKKFQKKIKSNSNFISLF